VLQEQMVPKLSTNHKGLRGFSAGVGLCACHRPAAGAEPRAGTGRGAAGIPPAARLGGSSDAESSAYGSVVPSCGGWKFKHLSTGL